jgi:hypothetical protein
MLALEIFTHWLLRHEKEWPDLADMRQTSKWALPKSYKNHARMLLSVALLHRTPELPAMRLSLQKARAMTSAGLAHLFHKEVICLQHFSVVLSGLDLGPYPELGETDENYHPTVREERDFYRYAPSEAEFED